MNFKIFAKVFMVVMAFIAISSSAYSQDDVNGSSTSPNLPDEVTKVKPGNNGNYDTEGYDANGFDANGYDRNGYDKNGYDKFGYNADGYDINGKFEGNTENYMEKQRRKEQKPPKQSDDGDHFTK